MVPIHKEPHWVRLTLDDIMVFMMCGTHLDREVHAAGDSSDPVQPRIGRYPQTPRNKGNGRGGAPKTSTKTTFSTESTTEKGTLSQEQEDDQDLGDKDTIEHRNNQ